MSRNQFEGFSGTVSSGGGDGSIILAGDVVGSSAANRVETISGTANLTRIPAANRLEWGTAGSTGTSGYLRFPSDTGTPYITWVDANSSAIHPAISTISAGGIDALVIGEASASVPTYMFGQATAMGNSAGSYIAVNTTNQDEIIATSAFFIFADQVQEMGLAVIPTSTGTNVIRANSSSLGGILITQDDESTASSTAAPIVITAQEGVGANSTGGALTLGSGAGTVADGQVTVQAGGNTRFTATGTAASMFGDNNTSVTCNATSSVVRIKGSAIFLDDDNTNNAAITISPQSASGSSIQCVNTVTQFTIHQGQLSTSGATGAPTIIQAQPCNGTNSIGGYLSLESGAGTTSYGELFIDGAMNTGFYESSIASLTTFSVPVANSGANNFLFFGTLAADCAITLNREITDGNECWVRNNTIGGFNITVQYGSGSPSAAIAPNTAVKLIAFSGTPINYLVTS